MESYGFCRGFRVNLNPDRITPLPGNPGAGSVGQVLVHPSHICQIGESDQGLIVWPSNPQPLPHKVDTNLVENMIRPTKLGAKNSMFFGSLDTGTNNALFYTLMANCKNHGLDPEMYLTEVIKRLDGCAG